MVTTRDKTKTVPRYRGMTLLERQREAVKRIKAASDDAKNSGKARDS